MTAVRKSTPEPPIVWPIDAPANMKPLAEPRSSSGSTLTASASMATSMVAANALCRKITAVKSAIWCTKSMPIAAKSEATMPTCIRKIQVRRRPKRCDEIVSTNGPTAHLNAHGR